MALDVGHSGFSDALVILGAAGLVIPGFARFRISPVIGFILVGLLVGPAGIAIAGADVAATAKALRDTAKSKIGRAHV